MCDNELLGLTYFLPGIIFSYYFIYMITRNNKRFNEMELSNEERMFRRSEWLMPKYWFSPSRPMLFIIIGAVLLIIGLILYRMECGLT